MNFQDVLNSVCNGDSDNKTSKKINVSRITFSRYRNGHAIPNDATLDRIIELTGLDAMKVYYAAYAEKINNPKVAEEFRKLAEV